MEGAGGGGVDREQRLTVTVHVSPHEHICCAPSLEQSFTSPQPNRQSVQGLPDESSCCDRWIESHVSPILACCLLAGPIPYSLSVSP